jgi:uncharacterized membrane protein
MPLEPIISKISIRGHPLHPAMIHFPVAALIALIATDIAWILTGDFFWARGSLWLSGVGTIMGWAAGLAGLLDLLLMPRVRRLVTGWSHAILAVMLLSVATLNWLLRVSEPDRYILPWGIYLSVLSGLLIAAAAYLGALLVYEYAVGVDVAEAAERHAPSQPDNESAQSAGNPQED